MPTINCTDFERILGESVTERVPADSAVLRTHADRCPTCRIEWERYAVLERVIPLWKSRGAEADLSDVVLARLAGKLSPDGARPVADHSTKRQPADNRHPERQAAGGQSFDRPSRPESSSRWARNVVLAVAAVVMVVSLRQLFLPRQRIGPSPRVVKAVRPTLPVDVSPRTGPRAGLTDLFRDAGSAYSDLAREAADAAGDAVAFVPSAVAVRPKNDSADAHQKSNWTKEWQRPFEPIGQDVSDAVDFLFGKMKTL